MLEPNSRAVQQRCEGCRGCRGCEGAKVTHTGLWTKPPSATADGISASVPGASSSRLLEHKTSEVDMSASRTLRRGFSLIELVIVVVIIGIIAAIAVPRMSRGAAGASDSSVNANLAVLRNALDMFQSEHGGVYPSGTAANIVSQLTGYTNDQG